MPELLYKLENDNFIPANPEPNKSYRYIPKKNNRFVEIDKDPTSERTITLSVSSETPYFRWYGWEELDHSNGAVDLSRLQDGAQCLFNHDFDQYIGVIEKAWLENSRLYCEIRFDTHQLADQIFESIYAGIVRNVSIGYEINELRYVGEKDDVDIYRATKWTPFEVSIVTVPADATVGVNRSYFMTDGRGQKAEGRGNKDLLDSSEGKDINKTSAVCPQTSAFIGENSDLEANLGSKDKNMSGDSQVLEVKESDVRQQERERVGGIYGLVKKYGHQELGQKAIDDGLSIVEARSLYLDKVKDTQAPVGDTLNPVDLPNKEARKYSFVKAIAYAAGKIKESECGLELEVSDHIQNSRMGGKPAEGIYVDQTRLVSFRAPYDTSTPAAAGDLISTDLLADRFIEALYNQSAFLAAGVTYMRDLTGNVEIPRESTFTNGYWIAESDPITEDEGTFDKISLSPHKLACLSKVTYEMINQSSIDIERLMRARLIRGLALELDRTIGFGSGTGEEPLGILSHPEVLSIVLGTNGGTLDWAALINMQSEIDNANAMMGGEFNYVVNSRTKGKLMQTLDNTTGSGSWIWRNNAQAEGSIAGYRARCSNQIPNNLTKGTATDLTAAFFGDFSNVLLGIWAGLDVMVDPYSESSNAIIKVIAKQLADIQLTRGDYFCVATDIQNN